MSGGVYSLDTNSVLTAWNGAYRPANFASFWTRLDELLRTSKAQLCEEVFRELSAKDDEAANWIKERQEFVVPLEEEQVALVRQLARDHPALAKERLGRMRADGFVIALAQWRALTVVTYENNRGSDKIPNICNSVGVECISLADMIEREGWTF